MEVKAFYLILQDGGEYYTIKAESWKKAKTYANKHFPTWTGLFNYPPDWLTCAGVRHDHGK